MALLKFSEERPDEQIRRAVEKTIEDAKAEWHLPYEGEYPISGIGISELRAKHVGMANNYWQATITTSYADWINKVVSDNAYLVITGLFNLTPDPQTTEIFPNVNGLDLPRLSLEQMYALDLARVWFTKPFAAKPDSTLKIEIIGKAAGTEQIGLIGYAVAKKAYLIAAAPT